MKDLNIWCVNKWLSTSSFSRENSFITREHVFYNVLKMYINLNFWTLFHFFTLNKLNCDTHFARHPVIFPLVGSHFECPTQTILFQQEVHQIKCTCCISSQCCFAVNLKIQHNDDNTFESLQLKPRVSVSIYDVCLHFVHFVLLLQLCFLTCNKQVFFCWIIWWLLLN